MDKKIGIGIVALVLVSGISFYGGMRYEESKDPFVAMRESGMQGGPIGMQERFESEGGRTVRMGGGTAGEIIAKDDKSITVELRDGGSVIVFLTEATPVAKSAAGSIDDLMIGEEVVVSGTKNDDGSVTAENVQIKPLGTGIGRPDAGQAE